MIDFILDSMNSHEAAREIQKIQTAYRLKLIELWDVPVGASVLEIGCGQGDMTAALAYSVGGRGFVHGVDIAKGTYGSPNTLEQARANLLNSTLGSRIQIDFETDILSGSFTPLMEYDYVVLAHCAWYFRSHEQLERTLEKASQYAKKLCFVEWDSRAQSAEQLPHWSAVMIQALCSSFGINPTMNIQTLFTPTDISELVQKANWICETKQSIADTVHLQDGKWEVSATITQYPLLIEKAQNIPLTLKHMLLSQIKELGNVEKNSIMPLNAFVLSADRQK